MGRKSRDKGAAFENKVADLVRKAFNVPKKECYRTPLSGGHPFGDAGDLVIGDYLLPMFPFTVECKHTKAFRSEWFWSSTTQFWGWQVQVLNANKAQRDNRGADVHPLLIVRGNATQIYAILPVAAAKAVLDKKASSFSKVLVFTEYLPAQVVSTETFRRWQMVLFNELLERLTEVAWK